MFKHISHWLDLFEKFIITIGLASATLLLFTNVVMRYVFESGLPWALELVQYLFGWVVLVGAAHGVKSGIHLGIDVLVEKFSERTQRWLALLALFICLLFSGTVFVLSLQYIIRIHEWGDLTLDLQIPQWIPYLAIPVGLGLMFLHFLNIGLEILRGKRLSIHAREAPQTLEELQQ